MDLLPKFVDLAREPKEIGEDLPAPEQPIYPYGLCLCFDQETLDKLDLDSDAEVGDMIHIHALGKITSISKRDTESGPDCRVEIQLTAIALEDEHEEDEEAEEFMRRPSAKSMIKKAYGE